MHVPMTDLDHSSRYDIAVIVSARRGSQTARMTRGG
jgi:hypothetical protein